MRIIPRVNMTHDTVLSLNPLDNSYRLLIIINYMNGLFFRHYLQMLKVSLQLRRKVSELYGVAVWTLIYLQK